MVCFAVNRDEEFSGVKNKNAAQGDPIVADSPESARLALGAYHAKLARQAGATVVVPSASDVFEISPLVSYDGEDLAESIGGQTFTAPFVLERRA